MANTIDFLNKIKQELRGGIVLTTYDRFENEYITIDVEENNNIHVYFKGDKSVGECDLDFMRFDDNGFNKLCDYDEMNDDLSLDKVKTIIENNLCMLSKSESSVDMANTVVEHFIYVLSDIERTSALLKTKYFNNTFDRRINSDYINNNNKLEKIYEKIQDIERKFSFSIEELKKEVG